MVGIHLNCFVVHAQFLPLHLQRYVKLHFRGLQTRSPLDLTVCKVRQQTGGATQVSGSDELHLANGCGGGLEQAALVVVFGL